MPTTDFLVVGGGIVGLTIAGELKRRHPEASVTLLEKETRCGAHASGRNSGVLHAGFYYTADSLKARFTRDGNRAMTEYCLERALPINPCGKLVVARNEEEDALLDELMARGRRNGVQLVEVDPEEMRDIEPRAMTLRRALFSPTTATVSPLAVVQSLEHDALAAGVQIEKGIAYQGFRHGRVLTSDGTWDAGYVINAAGLYADRVAHDFGFGARFRILPFKGIYLKSDEPAGAIRVHIYPVPDLRNPFLGVHFTVQVDGRAKIGPTAIPALWREQYEGTRNFRLRELLDIGYRTTSLFAKSDFDFTRLAFAEFRKYSKRYLAGQAGTLASGVRPGDFRHWARPGIRAQLVDMKSRRLEMDFVIEGDDRSLHVLNAVSPGFTCSIPFARHVCDRITELTSNAKVGTQNHEDPDHRQHGLHRPGSHDPSAQRLS